MTKRLQDAFVEASKLPDDEQDRLAQWVLDELALERRWDSAFSASQDALSSLAHDALEEHRSGQTEELDLDRL